MGETALMAYGQGFSRGGSHWALRAGIRNLDFILNETGESLEGCEQGSDVVKLTFSLWPP